MSAKTFDAPAKVYFADIRSRSAGTNRAAKIERLFDAAGFGRCIAKGGLTAVKLHFGELGCDTHVSPTMARAVVDKIKARGGKPFLTDCNTLYSGSRHNAADHLVTAIRHGFDSAVTGAPLIIADGLDSTNETEVAIAGRRFKTVKIAADIVSARSMMVISHFKGHEMAGFGGAVKNLAMGCCGRSGKQDQHCVRFEVDREKCVGCQLCRKVCPRGAVSMVEDKAVIDKSVCVGCGECLTVCKEKAVGLDFQTEIGPFMERMVEYALGAVTGKRGRVGFFNVVVNVTPDCDCVPWSDAPIVPDVGLLAGHDPVALDKASFDLVNERPGFFGCKLTKNHAPGADKFKGLWPGTRGELTWEYGREIGLGTPEYELIRI